MVDVLAENNGFRKTICRLKELSDFMRDDFSALVKNETLIEVRSL